MASGRDAAGSGLTHATTDEEGTMTPISTREDISIWWSARSRTYDITVRELGADTPDGPLREADMLYWQTRSYREARTYRWMLLNKRNQRVI